MLSKNKGKMKDYIIIIFCSLVIILVLVVWIGSHLYNMGDSEMKEYILNDITVNYVTRAYTTRHGAGPLNNEGKNKSLLDKVVDETNIPNNFQGSLRFAPLDLGLFDSITSKDFLNYAPRSARKNMTITCMDQLSDDVAISQGTAIAMYHKSVFEDVAEEKADFLSYGPTRNTTWRSSKE